MIALAGGAAVACHSLLRRDLTSLYIYLKCLLGIAACIGFMISVAAGIDAFFAGASQAPTAWRSWLIRLGGTVLIGGIALFALAFAWFGVLSPLIKEVFAFLPPRNLDECLTRILARSPASRHGC